MALKLHRSVFKVTTGRRCSTPALKRKLLVTNLNNFSNFLGKIYKNPDFSKIRSPRKYKIIAHNMGGVRSV